MYLRNVAVIVDSKLYLLALSNIIRRSIYFLLYNFLGGLPLCNILQQKRMPEVLEVTHQRSILEV